jgi:hypothetical protein
MNETIFIKSTKRTKYTVIDNRLICDDRLSAKARMICIYILSLPEDWVLNFEELCTHFKEGSTSVRNGLKELETFGYLKKERIRDESMKITGMRYVINEIGNVENHNAENLNMENPQYGKAITRKNHNAENSTLQNTNNNKILNSQNTDLTNSQTTQNNSLSNSSPNNNCVAYATQKDVEEKDKEILELKKQVEELNKKLESASKIKKTSKKSEYTPLLEQEFYTDILKKYNSVFMSLQNGKFPNSKNYKQQVDKILIRSRELGINDADTKSKILEAITNAPKNDFWRNEASGSLSFILSETGMNKLTGSVSQSQKGSVYSQIGRGDFSNNVWGGR